ncbi:SpoIID/LytB domain-containing protein [Gudongella sp. DL1XJH-153]|uniref:SpoIID/LytB domain-containing protein n=1 Tax=Gudongella sp. DL1XJH-153 TaxID=3409804 RepID=UPI003BB48E36
MKKKLLILIVLIMVVFPENSYGRIDQEVDFIDVKIGKTYSSLERVKISSANGIAIYQKNDKEDALMELPGDTMYISLSLGKFDDIDVYDDSNTYVTTLPANGTVLFAGDIDDNEHLMIANGKKYRGYIAFIGDRNGLNVINHLDIESYLYGVVPKEIPAMSGQEALKAQAVAARSYAYSTMTKHAIEGFNVCDTTHCQVYGGYESEHINTNKAVDDTNALVAVYNGNIASTVFHSSSGGHTESSENVWGGKVPYLIGKNDPYSLNSINSNWKVEMDVDLLSEKLISGGIDIGGINSIDISDKTESGRIIQLVFNGSSGDAEISGERFRSLLGTTNIKSTLFSIEAMSTEVETTDNSILYVASSRRIQTLESEKGSISIIYADGRIRSSESDTISVIGDKGLVSYKAPEVIDISRGSVVISGRGYGHGIGMSQYGAIEMAKEGYDFEEILQYYYTGIEIIKY